MRARKVLFGLLAVCIAVGGFSTVSVLAATSDTSKNISQSYSANGDIPAGSIVSLETQGSNKVTSTNIQNASKLVGVAVPADNSLVAVDPDAKKVQVATNGDVEVLVSTVNGDIKQGDRIAASPFNGIGMKSLGDGYIVGVAAADFSAATKGAQAKTVTDTAGKQKQVTIGRMSVHLKPGYMAEAGGKNTTDLQKFVKSLTGKAISMPRIILSIIVAILAVVGTAVLMYSAIYGSIISIGRNPLAHDSILKALAQVVFMAVLIFIVAFGLIFLLLQ